MSLTGDLSNLSSDLYKTALESAMDHIIITDPDGIILFANSSACRITGYSREEMAGKTPRLWGRMMDHSFYVNFWDTIKNKKLPFHGEITNKRKNGEIYIAKLVASPIIRNDTLIGFIGTEEDVTIQKNEEKMLKKKMMELEKLNRAMVGRELKMIELKKEIETLKHS